MRTLSALECKTFQSFFIKVEVAQAFFQIKAYSNVALKEWKGAIFYL